MTESAREFLESWRAANVYAAPRALEELDSITAACVADAKRAGLTEDALEQASGGLKAYLRAAIENADEGYL